MTIRKENAGEWNWLQSIENYALSTMAEHGLDGWSFGWDRAKRRLGVCRLQERRITLSIHFVRSNSDIPHEICDTVLHEVAHALAWTRFRDRTHGPVWKRICREIGAVPRASAPRDAIRVTSYKYALRLKTTGETVGHYHRLPSFHKRLKRMALRGRPETLGQLELVPCPEQGEPGSPAA